MNWNPGPPPPNDPSNYAAQQAQLMQRQIDEQMSRLDREYRQKLDQAVDKLSDELKASVVSRTRTIGISVVAAVVAAFAILVSVQTRTVNDSVIGFQNAVMSLQKEVLATASGLGEKASLIAAANKELETTQKELEATRAAYNSRLSDIEEAKRQWVSASQDLAKTRSEYEARLKVIPAPSSTPHP